MRCYRTNLQKDSQLSPQRGGYEMFVTFKVALLCIPMWINSSTLFAIFYPKTLDYSFRNLWFLLFSSLLVPCGIFDSFLLSKIIWGALILPVVVLDSARTMQRPAEHFILLHPSGPAWKLYHTRIIWLCKGQTHTKISSTVMQDLSMPLLTISIFSSNHTRRCMWESHLGLKRNESRKSAKQTTPKNTPFRSKRPWKRLLVL